MKFRMKFGREAFQVLKTLLKPSFWILLWMSLLRFLLFVALYQGHIGLHADLPKAFFAGARFDLLILGFFWLPLVVITWLSAFAYDPRKLLKFYKLYFCGFILLQFDFAWWDLFWVAVHQSRLDHQFFTADFRSLISEGVAVFGVTRAFVFPASMGLAAFGLILSIWWLKIPKISASEKGEMRAQPVFNSILAIQILGSLLLVALAARGTWTAHHLNSEHAQISNNPLLNQLALNPIWNADK